MPAESNQAETNHCHSERWLDVREDDWLERGHENDIGLVEWIPIPNANHQSAGKRSQHPVPKAWRLQPAQVALQLEYYTVVHAPHHKNEEVPSLYDPGALSNLS